MTHQFQSPIAVTVVRPAILSDVSALQRSCWPNRSIEGVTEFLQRAQKLRDYRRGDGVVAAREGNICGFGMLTIWPRAAEISDLIVSPGHRDTGIGTSIIEYLTAAARDLNSRVLEIGVALSNPRALTLYRRLGFCDSRTIQIDLGCGLETVLYLEKTLPPK